MTPWGTLSWFWVKQTIVDLFKHTHERHGVPLPERLMTVTSTPLEVLDGGGRLEWSRIKCYEATLYWLFVSMRHALHRSGAAHRSFEQELVASDSVSSLRGLHPPNSHIYRRHPVLH